MYSGREGLGQLYRLQPDGSYDAFSRDGLGSVLAEVSAAGALTGSFAYAAYGAVTTSGAAPILGFAGELTIGVTPAIGKVTTGLQ